MELDLPTFKKLEALGWTVAISFLLFFCGHLIIYLCVCLLVRKVYLMVKNRKLGLIGTEGKTVVVTGCDSGFGLGLAKRLYERGFTVFATCLNPDSQGGKELQAINSDKLKVISLDVSLDDSVARCLKVVREQCQNSGLWGLVNNAGANFVGDAELTTIEQYLTQGNINLYGTVRTCKAFLPLIRQAKGRIVNVTSVKGQYAIPSCGAYTITKFGGEAFSDTLRQEMKQFGIKVSIIEPCNYGGITGCLSEAGLKRIKSELDEMWNNAGDEVRQLYGHAHLMQQLEGCKKSASTTASTIEPVLKAFEDALRNQCPQVRYLISGSNSFFDFYYVLGILAPYLPQTLFDKIRAYFCPYIIYK